MSILSVLSSASTFTNSVSSGLSSLGKIWDKFIQLVKDGIQWVKDWFSDAWEWTKDTFDKYITKPIETFFGWIETAIGDIGTWFSDIWEDITETWNKFADEPSIFFDWIEEKIGNIGSWFGNVWDSISLPDWMVTIIDFFKGEGIFEGMSISDRLDLTIDLPDWLVTTIDFFTGEGIFAGMSISDRLDLTVDLPDWLITIIDFFTGDGDFAGMSIGDRLDFALDAIPSPFSFILDLFTGMFDISIGDYVDFTLGALGDTWDFLVDLITDPIGTLSSVTSSIGTFFSGLGTGLGDLIQGPLIAAGKFLAGLWNSILDFMTFSKIITNPITGTEYSFGLDLSSFKIPVAFLAKGGIVNKATLAMIGESGPEAVIPLTGTNAKNAGIGSTYNITVNASGITDRSDKRAMAREIGNMIQQEMARKTGTSTFRGRYA